MTFKDLKQRAIDIDLLEKDLMRDLTVEEKDLVATEGYEALFKKLGLNIKDAHLMRRVKDILGAYFTLEPEEYEEIINKEDNSGVIEVLEDVLRDLKKEDEGCTEEEDPVVTYARKLKEGEILELESEVLDKVIDYLWTNENNIKIEVRNNKIRLR